VMISFSMWCIPGGHSYALAPSKLISFLSGKLEAAARGSAYKKLH
jgi:hypothetical protein